jgi:hypothetical protein
MPAKKRLQATGAAAIATSLTPPSSQGIYLVCVRLNLSAAGGVAENFTITLNSETAAVYDNIMFSQDMNTVQDLMWLPDQPVPILGGDVVDFAYANTNTRTYGLEVIYQVGG